MVHRTRARTARHGFICAALLILAGAPGAALAQESRPALVRVHVTDSAHVALAGVDLVVIKDKTDPVLFGRTGPDGRFAFAFEP